jgi:hypothetical protein
LPIQIIKSRSGPNTTEQIQTLVFDHPDGITLKQICKVLNRPVSMIQRCLKPLIASRQIYFTNSPDGMHLVYYPKFSRD